MPSRPNFNVRLRAYTPLGAAGQVIPDQGITITSAPDGPTLQATVSTVTYRTLPHDLEVAVEVFDDVANAWVEGRDSRFVCTKQQGDERDVTATATLTGVGLMQWLAGRAALSGVQPLQANGNVEAAASTSTARVSGHTFTWGSHILGTGDRIKVTNSGKAKGLSTGAVYYVRNPTSSTFQVSQTPTGAIKSFGSSNSVHLSRVRTRINIAGQPFTKNQAISVWDATANQNLTNGSQYFVVNPTSTTIQVATKPGGIPIELVADALIVYRYLDGARTFSSQTPGSIMSSAFLEARNRGWGQDAAGNDQVFHSWTIAGDSNSLAWPARVDDPTVAGVAVSFQPGTSLWDMLTFLVDNDWAEFASHGRTLDLFAPLTGSDYSGNRRIGGSASSAPKTVDLTNYATTEIVRGDGPVEVTAKVARSPWGVLEVYSTASGIGSSAAAKSYGNADLARNQTPSVGWTLTETASAAQWLPLLDYQRGDWVSAFVEGAWTKLRVIQWAVQKNTDGTTVVTATLQAKTRHLLKKVAKAAKAANGGRALTTTSSTPVESDARKAAVPANLTVSSTTRSAADKSAAAVLQAAWAAVTTDEDGNDLIGASYEVTVRTDGAQVGSVVTTTTALTADLPAQAAGSTVAVSVRAISNTGAYGEASPEVEYQVGTPEATPDPPSAPIVTSTLGSITVAWDGNLVDAIDGAHTPTADDALAYIAVQRSTDQQTWTTEAQTLNAAGSVVDLGLTVGTEYYYQLVAVSSLGVSSGPSPVGSATVVGIDVAQINAGFTAAMTQVEQDSQNAQQIANQSAATAGNALTTAQDAQTAASNAVSAANGKTKNTYATTPPSGNGNVAGDLWFEIDGTGAIVGQWNWDGTAWQQNTITGQVITNLDAGSITTGTLNAARIGSRSISATQIAVADFTNLFPSPHLDAAGGGPQWALDGTNAWAYTGSDVPVGNAIVVAARDNISTYPFPVKAGDSFYIEYTCKTVVSGSPLTASLWVEKADGSWGANDSPAWAPFNLLYTPQTQLADLGNGWARKSTKVTIPSTWTGVAVAALYFQIDESQSGTLYAIADLLVRRAANATLIVDGSITANSIAAGAIDGKTITGATIQTASTATTSGGVILDHTGITGYNASGAATFRVDNAGNTSMTGTIHATAGTVDGTLSIGASGSIQAARSDGLTTTLDQHGIVVDYGSNGQTQILPNDLLLNDGDGRTANLFVNAGGQATITGTNGIDLAGNVFVPAGYLQVPDSYSRVETARSLYINSSGTLGTTSSSRRTKNLHRHLKMDDTVLERWLGLPTWEFEYKPEMAPDSPGIHHGLVAEEVEAAGFAQLIYYDEREDSDTKGQVDGFAYERMGVYNHMALKRLYARLQAAEKQLAALTGKA